MVLKNGKESKTVHFCAGQSGVEVKQAYRLFYYMEVGVMSCCKTFAVTELWHDCLSSCVLLTVAYLLLLYWPSLVMSIFYGLFCCSVCGLRAFLFVVTVTLERNHASFHSVTIVCGCPWASVREHVKCC